HRQRHPFGKTSQHGIQCDHRLTRLQQKSTLSLPDYHLTLKALLLEANQVATADTIPLHITAERVITAKAA
ncbi:MAG: hypothetical protein WAU60_12415, partial [Candidatus Competibacter denitrificans]